MKRFLMREKTDLAATWAAEQGFTFIETLIALFVLSVGLLALGGLSLNLIQQDQLSRERTMATHLAEQLMEEWVATDNLLTHGFTAAPAVGTSLSQTVNLSSVSTAYTVTATAAAMTGAGPVTGAAAISYTGTPTPMMRTMTVAWLHAGRSYQVLLTHVTKSI